LIKHKAIKTNANANINPTNKQQKQLQTSTPQSESAFPPLRLSAPRAS
jgi:hypothetical protein